MISVWRIGHCPTPQPRQRALLASLGFGSTLGNGRWHTRGPLHVVYAASSRALCQLEKRVHCNGAHPKDQALMRLDLPEGAALLDVADLGLPADWRNDEGATRTIGARWTAEIASLGLWVPSYVEPGDRNLLLNPAHTQYSAIELVIERNPFRFDPRLF